LKWFSMCLKFSEIFLIYGKMTVPWYIVPEEGRFPLNGFIMESTNYFGYSLSIRPCFVFFISSLKSFWFWHMILNQLIKLWS
jgi:hypothetical protein